MKHWLLTGLSSLLISIMSWQVAPSVASAQWYDPTDWYGNYGYGAYGYGSAPTPYAGNYYDGPYAYDDYYDDPYPYDDYYGADRYPNAGYGYETGYYDNFYTNDWYNDYGAFDTWYDYY